MITLSNLKNTVRKAQKSKRVGRGVGCKKGKTCGRGHKGDKSRSGYKRRSGKEGGQQPLYRKIPTRGFSNVRFRKEQFSINLEMIEERFADGEVVNFETLHLRGLAPRHAPGGLKILGQGELTKKVKIFATSFSQTAREKLEKASISFTEVARTSR